VSMGGMRLGVVPMRVVPISAIALRTPIELPFTATELGMCVRALSSVWGFRLLRGF
jgi:hypothetical protein